MARRTPFVLVATFVAALALPTVPALAGGGCHDGATTGEGDTVEMKDACFRPSTLRIDPGDTVTFVNRDAMTHNVTANGWGRFEGMNQGDTFQATFEESGIYAFACQYHPGMTGAIVVGDGTGSGSGESVTVASYRPPAASESQVLASEPVSNEASSSAVGWVAGGAIGIAIGVAGGLLVRRRRGASA
jgi:plastocyanin